MLEPGLLTPTSHPHMPPPAGLLPGRWPGYSGPERRAAGARPWLVGVLDEVDYGMILVDAQARLLHVNSCARARLRAGDGLRMEAGRLAACQPHEQVELASAILAAASRGLRRLIHVAGPAHAVSVAVMPVRGSASGEGGALVMMSRSHVCEPLSTDCFARSHGLTQTESRVLHALCSGRPPADIATALGVALSTVRTHIGTIRAKTGAPSVRELLHRVALLPPMRQVLGG